MMQEIIYTSAQRGLKPGSSGFCTVVCTAGIDARTSQRLEGLSGYRHPFAISDPRNPVNYQHITMRIGAARTHVLSRVCDAGPDHTGRTNKLAHHIAFTQPTSPSGPAHLFNQAGAFTTQWDGKTAQRPPRSLPVVPVVDATLTAWKTLTGDGGWAGSIAEKLLSGKQPVYVIFPAGTDTLTLLQEVLEVVPPARRWEVTFSTYYTSAIAGAECQLRFVLDDTKEATRLRNDARADTVDLTKPLAAAAGGQLVTTARAGRVSHNAAAAAAAPTRVNPPRKTAAQAQPTPAAIDDWPDASQIPETTQPTYAQASATAPPPVAPDLFGNRRSIKEAKLARAGRRSKWPWVVAAFADYLTCLVSSGTVVLPSSVVRGLAKHRSNSEISSHSLRQNDKKLSGFRNSCKAKNCKFS